MKTTLMTLLTLAASVSMAESTFHCDVSSGPYYSIQIIAGDYEREDFYSKAPAKVILEMPKIHLNLDGEIQRSSVTWRTGPKIVYTVHLNSGEVIQLINEEPYDDQSMLWGSFKTSAGEYTLNCE